MAEGNMTKAAAALAAALAAGAAFAADLSLYIDKGYAIGTDSAARGVRVFKASEAGEPEVVWEWLCQGDAAFTGGANNIIYTSEVKVRDGGRKVLVAGATDWAVIDAGSGSCIRSGHVNDGGHGIDILPDGTIIKGDSNSATAGSIWLIPENGSAKRAADLASCHGVEWDQARQCVWAIGYTEIVKLVYDSVALTLTEVGRWTITGTSGHSLDLAEDGKLYYTDWYGVRRFDPDTGTSTTLYALSNPKSISHSEKYGDIVELPSGYSDKYSANKIRVYPKSGDGSTYYEVTPTPQMKMYRARWVQSFPAALVGDPADDDVHYTGESIDADPGIAGKYDVTDSVKLLCAPTRNVSNWSTSQARAITTIHPYEGRLWTSGGDWYNNTGSSPIFSIDPATGAYKAEYTAGTETVWYFREGSDGSLYVPGVDQNERDNSIDKGGAYFRRKTDGSWEKYLCNSNSTETTMRIPFGNIAQGSYGDAPSYEGMMMHTWDLANWKGRTFVCGYGIAYGTEGGSECMVNATPELVSPYRMAQGTRNGYTYSSSNYRRFESFLQFDDDLFCFTGNPFFNASWFDIFPFEEWRFDEATGRFTMTEVPWGDVAPGIEEVAADYGTPLPGSLAIFWQPVKFGSRVLYLVGVESTSVKPWYLVSAVCEDHHVKGTRINLGKGVTPFSITLHDGKVAVVAAQYDATDGTAVNSVWESTDGLNFRRLFSFKATQQASALAYMDGSYYVGMGWKSNVPKSWGTLSGADTVGNIYRIPFDHEYTPVALSPAVAAVKDNGASAVLSVKVSCIDSAAGASLSLAFNGEVVETWESVEEGGTYSATVATVPGASYSFAFVAKAGDGSETGSTVVASGSFAATTVEGWFEVNFGDAGYAAGTGWTDQTLVTNPQGTWDAGESGAELVEAARGLPRRVVISSTERVTYTPDDPSEAGADVSVSGEAAITAAEALPDADEGMVASLFFRYENDVIVPYGWADGEWHRLALASGALESGDWVKYAIDLDLNSGDAPRLQYSLGAGGAEPSPLAADGGAAWIALSADTAPKSVKTLAWRGDGAIGNVSGVFKKVIGELVAPVIGGGDGESGGAGSGLSFAGGAPGTANATFSMTVSNPVVGAYYTAFTTEDLGEPFLAETCVQATAGDDVIPLGVDASGPSKFVKLVVSTTPFTPGAPLPEE